MLCGPRLNLLEAVRPAYLEFHYSALTQLETHSESASDVLIFVNKRSWIY